jgi:hypothetical protein
MRRARQALGVLGALLSACAPTARDAALARETHAPATATPTSTVDADRARYLHDAHARRAALEASLHTPTNLYSRQRLDAYGLVDRGWDTLPEWRPRADRVDAGLGAQLARGERPPVTSMPLWDGQTPTSPEAWVALGRRVFFEYPMRAEVYLEHALARPELRATLGVEATAGGELPGVVYFLDTDGEHQVGLTCALCHSAVEGGQVVAGRARRRLDYGRLRLAYHADTGEPLSAEQARRMTRWGPGRADVTEDDDEDPVAIPDLWGLSAQRWLTSAGTVRHDSPLALAVRQETQLIDAGHQRVRPPRVLVWALTQYLYTLAPPVRPHLAATATHAAGRALFAEHCRPCHHNAGAGRRPGGGDAHRHAPCARARAWSWDRVLSRAGAAGSGRRRTVPARRLGALAGRAALVGAAVAGLHRGRARPGARARPPRRHHALGRGSGRAGPLPRDPVRPRAAQVLTSGGAYAGDSRRSDLVTVRSRPPTVTCTCTR